MCLVTAVASIASSAFIALEETLVEGVGRESGGAGVVDVGDGPTIGVAVNGRN